MTRQTQLTITIALLLFSAVWGAMCFLSLRENAIGLLSDSYIYLLLTDFFSPFHSLNKEFAEYLFSHYAYPPGFPIVLGLLGGGSQLMEINYVIDAMFLGAAVTAFFVWLLTQGLSRTEAVLLACLFALLPGTLLSGLGILSEHPYLFATLFAASLLSSAKGAKHFLFAAALIGFAALIRSVGVAAIIAFAIFCIANYANGLLKRRTIIVSLVIAVLPIASWSLVRNLFGFESSYSDSIINGGYFDSLVGIVNQIPINLRAFWHHFKNLFSSFNNAGDLFPTVLISLMILGWLSALRKLRFEALYVLLYLCVILAWPYPNHYGRFILVVLPFLLYYGYDGLNTIAAIFSRKTSSLKGKLVIGACYVFGLAVLSLPTSMQIVREIQFHHGTQLQHLARTPNWHHLSGNSRAKKILALQAMLNSMQAVSSLTPVTACVASSEPHFMHFYAKRRSYKPAPASVDETRFEQSLNACPFVFMMAVSSVPPSEFPAMYPFHRIKHDMHVLDVSFFEGETKKGTVSTMLVATGEAKKTLND